MSQGQPTCQTKPSPAQIDLLLKAVQNNGYLFASLHSGRTRRTFLACQARGWISGDGRITFTGRNAAHRFDADAYAAALPADHVDFELNRLATGRMPLPPVKDRFGGQAHVLAIPDTFIQYDVPPGRAAGFVGYSINTRHGLRTIMHTEYIEDGRGWIDGARIYLSDGKGGVQYAGTLYSEFQAYGPAGGPDLRQQSADLLDRTRRAHEELTAAAKPAPEPVPHTNPNTERADTLITSADVAELDEATAAETGARYSGVMVTGDADPVEFATWHVTPERAAEMLHEVTLEMGFRRNKTRSGKSISPLLLARLFDGDQPIGGTTGSGKNPDMPAIFNIIPEEAQDAFGTGVSHTMMEALRRSRTRDLVVLDPKTGESSRSRYAQTATKEGAGELPEFTRIMARNHKPLTEPDAGPADDELSPVTRARMNRTLAGLAGAAAAADLNPATVRRLSPAVDPGPFRHQVEQLRNAIVAIIGDVHGIAGNVAAPDYRIKLHTARLATTSERARDALMKLENALSQVDQGADRVARVILTGLARRLGRPRT